MTQHIEDLPEMRAALEEADNAGLFRVVSRDSGTHFLRRVLAAAYPHIAARVLADTADEMHDTDPDTARKLDAISALIREAHPQ